MSVPENKTLLWLVAIGFFMETLDATIVNTALPQMAISLNTKPLAMQSVVVAYTLTLAVMIPTSGWLTDRFGTRKVYLWAIAVFTFGSLVCSLATTLPILVFSRVIQGIGGSMLLPVGRLAVLRAFPGEKYLPALSFVTMPALLGPLVGPPLGGWLVEHLSWHWIFLINIPIGIIGFIATMKSMPEDEKEEERKFDLIGLTQITIFMIGFSLALDGISDHHLSQGMITMLFVGGVAGLVTYILRAPTISYPLIRLALFKNRHFSIGIVGNLFSRLGSTCMPFLLPLYLQLNLNYSPFEAGLTMLPLAVSAILAKRLVTPMVNRFGYRNFLVTNTILVGLSIASFAFLKSGEFSIIKFLQLIIFGTVNSAQFTAMNTLTMKDLDKRISGDGNSLFSMVQMLSMSFSVATAASLLSTFFKYYSKQEAFQYTFIFMGLLTCVSTFIFWQVDRKPIKRSTSV